MQMGPVSAPALVAQAPTVRIRGTAYPVLLPKLRELFRRVNKLEKQELS